LEVDIEVISTKEKYNKLIVNAPGELSAADIQASKAKLATMKFHPREDEININLIARAERLFEGRLGEQRDRILEGLKAFEAILETQNREMVAQAQADFTVFLDSFEQDRLF
jgi:molecular chaperone HscC